MKGIKFDDTHSYFDLNLILSDCSISPATPKTNFIDIPGADGSLDLTEALGSVKYNDRTGKLIFSVLPSDDFEEKKSEIANFLNGQKFKITLDKDPDWYYIGRCSVNDWKCDKRIGQITVDLKLQPWKLKQELTVHEFEHPSDWFGKYFVFQNLKKPAKVTVTCSTPIKLGDVHGEYSSLSAGTHILSEPFVEGENSITIDTMDAGKITISYQEGCL